MVKVPTLYLQEKNDLISRHIERLTRDESKVQVHLAEIIHNANSILMEAKKWQVASKERERTI